MRRWAMGFHRKSRPLIWSKSANRVATEAESSPVPTRATPTSSTAHNDVSELTQCAVLHHSAHCRSQFTMTSWEPLSTDSESANTAKESDWADADADPTIPPMNVHVTTAARINLPCLCCRICPGFRWKRL